MTLGRPLGYVHTVLNPDYLRADPGSKPLGDTRLDRRDTRGTTSSINLISGSPNQMLTRFERCLLSITT